MQRPEIRVIDNQQVTTTDVNVSQSEADYILAKYGFKQPNPVSSPVQMQSNPQTFEEMVHQQEQERQRLEREKYMRTQGPQPVSFDSRNINYSETKWSDMEVDDMKLGIKIQIVTDMKF